MAVTAATVKAFAPQFAAVADAVINVWLGWAPGYIDETRYGTRYDEAVTLWTCHQLQVTQGAAASAAGAVTGMSAGDVDVTFAAGADSTGFKRTAYGQQYLALRRLMSAGPRCV